MRRLQNSMHRLSSMVQKEDVYEKKEVNERAGTQNKTTETTTNESAVEERAKKEMI